MPNKAVCTATVTAHSMSSVSGEELITLSITIPKFLLAQLNAHRGFSRNTESSRAIPTDVLVQRVIDTPVEPPEWFLGKGGMSPTNELLDAPQKLAAAAAWQAHREHAIKTAKELRALGVPKEWANRPLDMHVMVRVLITTGLSALSNFLNLRSHGSAQDYMQQLAAAIREAYYNSPPRVLNVGDWHVPFQSAVSNPSNVTHQQLLWQVAQAARISYGKDFSEPLSDAQATNLVYNKLGSDPNRLHASPFEHCAMVVPLHARALNRNLPSGYAQYRAMFECGLDLFLRDVKSTELLDRSDLNVRWEFPSTGNEPLMVARTPDGYDVTAQVFAPFNKPAVHVAGHLPQGEYK